MGAPPTHPQLVRLHHDRDRRTPVETAGPDEGSDSDLEAHRRQTVKLAQQGELADVVGLMVE